MNAGKMRGPYSRESQQSPLGDKLRGLRVAANFNQAQMAQLLHTGQNRVCDWEYGHVRPGLDVLERYAAVFNTTVAHLLDGVL
jgi:transcriptional regulator with XRE-family HTH domain